MYGTLLARTLGTMYNVSYVILINLVLQSIISGLIIDTFSKLREENEAVLQVNSLYLHFLDCLIVKHTHISIYTYYYRIYMTSASSARSRGTSSSRRVSHSDSTSRSSTTCGTMCGSRYIWSRRIRSRIQALRTTQRRLWRTRRYVFGVVLLCVWVQVWLSACKYVCYM